MATSRGRGYAINNALTASVRRPSEDVLKRVHNIFAKNEPQENIQKSNESPVKDEISELCHMIGKISVANPDTSFNSCTQQLMSLCTSAEKVEKCIDRILEFALKTKWNCHIVAMLAHSCSDLTVGTSKFRSFLLSKLEVLYSGRIKSYLEIEKFLMEATLLCEVFYHVRIGQNECIKVMGSAVLDYFHMLLDGSSQKEIEVFFEQFPKSYNDLMKHFPNEVNAMIVKIRKQIVCDATTVTVKALLLEVFESVLTNWRPLDNNAKQFYTVFSKPIIKICN